MPDSIRDGGGSGRLVKVSRENRLEVESKTESLQHHVSNEHEQAYQVIGTAALASGTITALHIKNISNDKNLIATYIRHQIIGPSGGTAFPNSGNYFSVALGRTYASGGVVTLPVNVFSGSGNTADVVAYKDTPVLEGTANEIDRWHTKADGDMNTYNKEGALIIPPSQTLELSYIGDQSSGILYARLSFIMELFH